MSPVRAIVVADDLNRRLSSMPETDTKPQGRKDAAGLFERISERAKANKSLTVVTIVIVAIIMLSLIMALTNSEDSEFLIIILFALVTIGLFSTLGVIFDTLDDK